MAQENAHPVGKYRALGKGLHGRLIRAWPCSEDGKNYGDFLLDTVEAAKEQFTDKEYEMAEGVSHGDQQY